MRQRRAVTEGGQAAAYAVGGEVLHLTVVVVQAGELPSLGHHEVADRTQPGIHAPRRYDTAPGCGCEVTAAGLTAGAHRGSRTGRRCAGKPPPRTWPRPRPRTRSSRRGRESARSQTRQSLPDPQDPAGRSTRPATAPPATAWASVPTRTPADGSWRSTASSHHGPSYHQCPNSSVS